MANSTAPEAAHRLAPTEGEVGLLDWMAARPGNRSPPTTLSGHLTQIARLGGYLARSAAGPDPASASPAGQPYGPAAQADPNADVARPPRETATMTYRNGECCAAGIR
jgi:hypothetical protein